MIWYMLGGALLVLIALALYFLNRIRSLPTFYAAYSYTLEQTGSKEEALRAAVSIFADRPPFNALTQTDIEGLIRIFVLLRYPQVLGRIFLAIDKGSDVNILMDLTKMREIAAQLDEMAVNQKWFE